MIGSFAAENLEYYLLGDLNVDFMSTSESSNRQKVKEILDIYEIEQLINGIFPYEWKASRLTPIFKSGTKSDPGNYRPISVIPCVAKIFEKIIFDQLYWYLGGNSLLTTCQSGFRSFHSTLTALLEATCDWSMNIDNGPVNGVVFI